MNDQALDHSSDSEKTVDPDPLDTLAELVVQRLTLSQEVAAVKYASGQPIDDSIREHSILESISRTLNGTRVDREIIIQFFIDQIEANKVIQRGLHQRWYAHPEEVPAVRYDLTAEVRPKFDCITKQMLQQFRHMKEAPLLRRGDIEDLIDGKFLARPFRQQLPGLHRRAAVFALRSFCTE
ncbi:MAG TPA: gamma subclass chorismate mutase AroQ [Streptosporangiaceae bacterium]|jgi:chorismate mutase|nr:gamma subclass chorismate mutase AroQ [Streptosporangiaceae bacterium]